LIVDTFVLEDPLQDFLANNALLAGEVQKINLESIVGRKWASGIAG